MHINRHDPLRATEVIGNYVRYARRSTRKAAWKFTPWRREFPLKYATEVQGYRKRHSKQYRKDVFGDRAPF